MLQVSALGRSMCSINTIMMLIWKHAGVAANAGGRQHATRAAQASNRRALGDIGNLVGAMSVRCNVAKDGVLE